MFGYANVAINECIEHLKTGLNPRTNFKLNVDGAACAYVTGKDIYDNNINITERTDKITKDAVSLINKRARLQDNILLFVSTGTGTVGRMALIEKYDGSWNVSETMYCIKVNAEVSPKYLMHLLYSDIAKRQFEPKISKGSVPHLKVNDLLSVIIPLPSFDEQQRVAGILDRFDNLCNDISTGLPAEIEARQKQYEYYRDKLLTFNEK